MSDPNYGDYKGEEEYYLRTGKLNIKPFWRRYLWHIIASVALILMIVFATTTVVLLINRSPHSTSSILQSTPTLIPPPTTANTPTAFPTATPTLSPTPCPTPCILYSENGADNWQGWALSSEWKVVSQGLLISTSSGNIPSAVAPYSIQGLSNFAVEAVIAQPEGVGHFGITACGSTQGDWQGYRADIGDDTFKTLAEINRTNDLLGDIPFTPGTAKHTYRFEIRGNMLTFLIDNAPVVHVSDDRYSQCGPQLGLWASRGVIHVSSFKVVAL